MFDALFRGDSPGRSTQAANEFGGHILGIAMVQIHGGIHFAHRLRADVRAQREFRRGLVQPVRRQLPSVGFRPFIPRKTKNGVRVFPDFFGFLPKTGDQTAKTYRIMARRLFPKQRSEGETIPDSGISRHEKRSESENVPQNDTRKENKARNHLPLVQSP